MAQAEEAMFGDYVIGSDLGAGHFGKVKLGQHAHTGEYVAIKIIDLAALKPHQVNKIQREVVCMSAVDHPNVAKLLDYNTTTTTYDGFPAAVLTIEFAERGELFDFMAHSGAFEDALARTFTRQLFSAVAACHACGVFHRDIKPENILIDHNFQLKLADFGLAIQLDENDDPMLKTECGSQGYMAPEVVAHMPYEGVKVDSWSAAVVAFVILTGNPPFRIARAGDWWFDQLDAANYSNFWRVHLRASPSVSEEAQNFLSRLLVTNVEMRQTPDEVLEDDWLAGEVYSPEELCIQMSARYERIEAAREKERLAARARVEAMRRRRGRGGDQFDGFAASVARGLAADAPQFTSIQPSTTTTTLVSTSAGEGGSTESVVQAPPAPQTTVTDSYSTCYIPEQPSDAVVRIRESLETLSIQSTQSDDYRLSCSVADTETEEGVEFHVQVYRDDSEPGLQGDMSYAKLVRTAGSHKKLSTLHEQLKQKLEDYYASLLSTEELLPDPPGFEML